MKKLLIFFNIITLSVLIGYFVYKKFKKSPPPEKQCQYNLSDFSFHYKKECDTPNILMLGDSRIGQGNWDSLLGRNDVINRGIYGDKMYCICQRLDYLKNSTAKIYFIEGGVMDLYHEEIDSIVNSYKTVVEFCKKENKIPVINLIVLLGAKSSPLYEKGNEKILAINEKLVVYTTKNNIDYIDLNPKLTKPNEHTLKDEYSIDGAHFNEAAYKIWASEVKIVLQKHRI